MKRKWLKVWACLLVVCMLMGTLAACGGGDGEQSSTPGSSTPSSSTPESSNQDESTPADAETTPTEDAGTDDGTPFKAYDLGGVTITLMDHSDLTGKNPANAAEDNPGDKADREANIARIEEKYNVHLEFVPIPTEDWDALPGEIVTNYTAGHPVADVMDAYYQFVGTYVANDILYDFGDSFDATGDFKSKNYFYWTGKNVGISQGMGGEGIYYNKAWIQDLGMEYTPAEMFDRGMWSYEDMDKYMRDMKSKMAEDEYPFFATPYYWMLFATAANGEIILDPSGNLNYVTDPMLETLQYFQNWLLDGLVSYGDPVYNDDGSLKGYEGWSYPGNTFGQGKTVAMAHRAAWQAASEVANVELGFVPYPWGSNVTIGHTGTPGDYLTLSDNYAATYYDGQLICLTKGIEQKADPVAVMTMVLDLMGWNSVMTAYEAPADSKRCDWLEDGIDKDLYFFSADRERLEPYNSLDLDLQMNPNPILRENTSIRSAMISYYNQDMQTMIDNGFASPDVLQNYSEE